MDCDDQREGYINRTRPAYPAIHSPIQARRKAPPAGLRAEQALGGLITVAGGSWAVYVVTFQNGNLWQLQWMPPTPVEICAVGILILLHAKWRHSANAS